jgi:hypothetical protein
VTRCLACLVQREVFNGDVVNVVMWHDVIWGGALTSQLDTWHDADLTWMTGDGHGARIRGDDRWYLSVVDEW